MIDYEFAILISVFSFVYTVLLTDVDMIFNYLYNFLENNTKKKDGSNRWYFYVLIGCEKCVAGQLALWLYLKKNIIGYILNPFDTAVNHALFITFAILCAHALNTIHKRITNE